MIMEMRRVQPSQFLVKARESSGVQERLSAQLKELTARSEAVNAQVG